MTQRRLLVIEDEPQIAELICRVALEVGFVTRTAIGFRAIEAAYGDLQPDIIVLDILMPEMDGVEVLQFLHERFSTARIVLLSGSDGTSRRITASLGGALGLCIAANLAKPFRVPELRALFHELHAALLEPHRIVS